MSPTPVGSGARAAGMADAFVAVADDATAASWNPAGLVQLERPEISLVGTYNLVRELWDGSTEQFDADSSGDHAALNFASVTWPIARAFFGKNITLSASYQHKYDFNREFFLDITDTGTRTQWDFEQDGGLGAYTGSIGIELTPRLSIGASVNFWRNGPVAGNEWEQMYVRTSPDEEMQPTRTTIEKYKNIRGENFVIGVLWNPTPRWTLALRYDSALDADADYRRLVVDSITGPGTPIEEDRKVHFPDTWALGTGVRVNDRLTLSFSASFTDWDDFYADSSSTGKFSLIDGVPLGPPPPGEPDVRTDFDPTKTIRLGAEYTFVPAVPNETLRQLWTVRGGLFYDEEPASNRDTEAAFAPGDGDPDQYYGIAAGVGVQAVQRVNVDLAYQFRFGDNVGSDLVRGVPGFSRDVRQHRFLLSVVLYF